MRIYYRKDQPWFPIVFIIVMMVFVFVFLAILLHGVGPNKKNLEVEYLEECEYKYGDKVFVRVVDIEPLYSSSKYSNSTTPDELYCKAVLENGATVWLEMSPYKFKEIPGSVYENKGYKVNYYRTVFDTPVVIHGYMSNAKDLAEQYKITLMGKSGIQIIEVLSSETQD